MSSTFPPSSPVRGLYGITPEWDDMDRLVDGIAANWRPAPASWTRPGG
jgi:hypothetical protein